MKYIILLCFGLLYSFGLSAQNTEFIEPGEVSVRRAGDSVYVSLRLRVTDIGSDNLVTLTPVLYKGAGGVRSLPPVLYGSRRAQLRLWKKAKDKSAVPVCHNSGDTVFYRDTFRYEHWMNGSGLRLDAELRTCCRTMHPDPLLLASDIVLFTPAEEFRPVLADIVPALSAGDKLSEQDRFIERWPGGISDTIAVVRRVEASSPVIYFPVGETKIVPGYRNNLRELEHMLLLVDRIASSKDSRIVKILVMGLSSPDGPSFWNEQVANARARSLVDYLTVRTGLDASCFVQYNGKEAWYELRQLIAASDMVYRQEVLDVIDYTPVWDVQKKAGRLGHLQALYDGKAYRYLRKHFFPQLRMAGCVRVYYERIADTTAVVLNRSVFLARAGKYAEALEAVVAIPDPRADNLKGVCYMMTGDADKARRFFERSARSGCVAGADNLRQLEELLNRY